MRLSVCVQYVHMCMQVCFYAHMNVYAGTCMLAEVSESISFSELLSRLPVSNHDDRARNFFAVSN
jgi:hypothetical protein